MTKTAKEVSLLLAQRAEEIAKYLLPNGKHTGNEWCAGSVIGEAGESLKVHLNGEKSGVFCDFATGEAGDLLDLWRLNRNISLLEAISQSKQWLGIGPPYFDAYTPKKYVKPKVGKIAPARVTEAVKKYLVDERKLTEQILMDFQVGSTGNEIIFPYYRDGELINIKYLSLERPGGKKKIRAEANCEPCLFGWQSFATNTRELVLCEGEIDAMTLTQYGFPALSLPFGGGGGAKQQWVEYEFERLTAFDKIYLCLDNDPEGQIATAELIERLGRHRCFVIKLPHKDANACLQAGISAEEIKTCFAQAQSLDPTELKPARLYVEQVIEEFYPKDDNVLGIHPPWEKARGKILFRPDELSVWSGINGHGKSQLLGQIILETMRQEHKVCIASLELKPRRLLARLTRQAAGLSNPTVGYIEAIHQWYGDKLWLFDLTGNAKSQRLLEVFLYARQRYGITVFVIDSFMKLDIAEDDYKSQKAFLEKLCDFKNEFNCHIHLVVHPRKGADESKWPGKLDTKGTGAITDLADNCFVVWRNKAKEAAMQQATSQQQPIPADIADKPDVLWICDKQRNGGEEGKFGLWFHHASLQYLGYPQQKLVTYVPYSALSRSVN